LQQYVCLSDKNKCQTYTTNLTFALNSHFRSPSRKISFAFNVAMAERG